MVSSLVKQRDNFTFVSTCSGYLAVTEQSASWQCSNRIVKCRNKVHLKAFFRITNYTFKTGHDHFLIIVNNRERKSESRKLRVTFKPHNGVT